MYLLYWVSKAQSQQKSRGVVQWSPATGFAIVMRRRNEVCTYICQLMDDAEADLTLIAKDVLDRCIHIGSMFVVLLIVVLDSVETRCCVPVRTTRVSEQSLTVTKVVSPGSGDVFVFQPPCKLHSGNKRAHLFSCDAGLDLQICYRHLVDMLEDSCSIRPPIDCFSPVSTAFMGKFSAACERNSTCPGMSMPMHERHRLAIASLLSVAP